MLPEDKERVKQFFSAIAEGPRLERTCILIVTHLLPTCFGILDGLSQFVRVAGVIPKPRSIDTDTLKMCKQKYPVFPWKRTELEDPEVIDRLVSLIGSDDVILLDIGAYFERSLDRIAERIPGRLLGVVEDTENGQQQYEKRGTVSGYPCPIISVARSPLKESEDYWVGQSIVLSIDMLFRNCGVLMNGKEATVFGYGKIGRSVARGLWERHIRTSIVDTNPMRQIDALTHGFPVISKEEALELSDIIVGATGNKSLLRDDFAKLKDGAFIASVTSSETEWELSEYALDCHSVSASEFVKKYTNGSCTFYALNDGQAVNFVHGAVLGDFIYLVQAEIVKSVRLIGGLQGEYSIHDFPSSYHRAVPHQIEIAKKWLQYFTNIPDTKR